MSLSPGTRFGVYEISHLLGAGGMSEVYCARDTTLGRDVAIKVLPRAFDCDTERLARFTREAQTLAALNHPNIAQIYGVAEGPAGGRGELPADAGAAVAASVHALVMELVEGEDLSQRIARGAIPLDEALPIAKQLAEALEAAHEQGIVHRDLKPGNVKVRADGTVKVLDFGLAKAMDPPPGSGLQAPDLANSPTLTARGTQMGTILGTAAYMAPEQARGRAVDRRADIWAFGVVLFEMLTGRAMFSGDTVTDVIAAVVTREPDLEALPPATPARVADLLRRCLQKDPKQRLRDIGDARIELDLAVAEPPAALRNTTTFPALRARRGVRALALAAAAVAGVLVGAAAMKLAAPTMPRVPPRQLDVLPHSEDIVFYVVPPMLSPSGTHLLIPGSNLIRVRSLSDTDERELAGTKDASFMGWSPDGREIAWVARQRLWRMSIEGGRPTMLARLPVSLSGRGALQWLGNGRIVLAGDSNARLLEVPATGGNTRVLLPLDPKTDRDVHGITALPDGRTLVAVRHAWDRPPESLEVIDLQTRTAREILRFPGEVLDHPAWSPTGHLLFERSNPELGLWAVPFDTTAGKVAGDPFLLASAAGMPSVSVDGTLTFVRGGRLPWAQLVWVERDGRISGTIGRPQAMLGQPALDPPGLRAVATAFNETQPDVYVWDLVRGTSSRFWVGPAFDEAPTWAASGQAVLWGQRDRNGIVMLAPGSTEPQLVATGQEPHVAPDGKTMVGTRIGRNGSTDVFVMQIGQQETRGLLEAAADESQPRISRDGKLIAYVSDETGTDEVFVDSFPVLSGRVQVSSGGGHTPRWGPDGALHFISDDRLMVVSVRAAPVSLAGAPTMLFSLAGTAVRGGTVTGLVPTAKGGFDIDPRGRLLMLHSVPRPEGPPLITVVTGTLPQLTTRSR